MNEQNVLVVSDLSVGYENKPVISDVSLTIPAGTMTAIVGPNGAGKSTFVKSLLELVPKQKGDVIFFGERYSTTRDRIGYVPQRTQIDWDFPITVLEVVLMGLHKKIKWYSRFTKQHKELAIDALAQVGMDAYAKQHIKALSGGQQQRVFLARALVEQADLYILDEPLVGIDKVTERIIIEQLHKLKEEGKTIMVVHHDLNTVTSYFDHVLMLNQQLIAFGEVNTTFSTEHIKQTFQSMQLFGGEAYVSV